MGVNLKELRVKSSNLSKIHLNVNLENLEYFDLSSNLIENFTLINFNFSILKNLRFLYLRRNLISFICKDTLV